MSTKMDIDSSGATVAETEEGKSNSTAEEKGTDSPPKKKTRTATPFRKTFSGGQPGPSTRR